MSIKTAIASNIAALWTSEKRLLAERRRAETQRRKRREPHGIDYFHQIDDPYSHLAAQGLLQLQAWYEVKVRVHLVPPPADWAAPERALLQAYARLDAARLSEKSALPFVDPGVQPAFSRAEAAAAELADALEAPDILTRLIDVGTRVVLGNRPAALSRGATDGTRLPKSRRTGASHLCRAAGSGGSRRAERRAPGPALLSLLPQSLHLHRRRAGQGAGGRLWGGASPALRPADGDARPAGAAGQEPLLHPR